MVQSIPELIGLYGTSMLGVGGEAFNTILSALCLPEDRALPRLTLSFVDELQSVNGLRSMSKEDKSISSTTLHDKMSMVVMIDLASRNREAIEILQRSRCGFQIPIEA